MPHFVPPITSAPFPDFPMSTYQFNHEEGERKVSASFGENYCPEIVENFYFFLVGCGFSPETVITAMQLTIDEMRSVATNAD